MNNTADNVTAAANICSIELNLYIDFVLTCSDQILGNQCQHQKAIKTAET
jgi:hypothetical protein